MFLNSRRTRSCRESKIQVKERILNMKAKQKSILTALLLAIALGMIGEPLPVYAAEATVTFGSNWYNKKSGDTFPVGVYLKAKAAIGDYHIEIEYDRLRLEYVDGADDVDEENGILILEGNQNDRQIKFWIRFKAISGGEAFIEVSLAEAALRNSRDGELFTITEYDSAPVHIKGTDTAALIEEQLAQETEQEREETAGEEGTRQEHGEAAGEEGIGQGRGETAGGDGTRQERGETAEGDGIRQGHGEMTGDEVSGEEHRETAGEDVTGEGRGEAAEEEGTGQNSGETVKEEGTEQNRGDSIGEGRNRQDNVEVVGEGRKKHLIFFNVFFVMILAALLLIVIVDVVAWNIIKKVRVRRGRAAKRKRTVSRHRNGSGRGKADLELIDLDLDDRDLEKNVLRDQNGNRIMVSDAELEWQFGRPIIKICNVTMEFKMSSVNPSGLKEYIVQLLKREVSYRRLYALYQVSFNIYKGEVIGIIGTNGSGKSTLLKIVSGALKPTEGYVEIVGRKKVQLLTLGTGFDMELTARENVFLNGSIIGYRREFLETHYDEIVEFAELQDFMEEKVKNFSSGMVSRLGFAIATAGEAAEILILDEILSVGDEFFREKSLKRIKEMIHGGSTVLMVSHSMGTILENCSRCVWIEKGVLKMVGDPGVVCEEYRRLNG